MGQSSQPKNTTTTTQVQLPSWLSNAYQNYFSQTQDVNNKPYQQYGGQTVAPLTADQQQATDLARGGAWGLRADQIAQTNGLTNIANGQFSVNPGSNPYLGQTTNVGSNPYMGQNPQLQSMINQANTNITNAYQNSTAPQLAAQFAQGGAFGGSAYNQQVQNAQNTLGQNLSNSTDNLLFQNYNQSAQLAQQQIQNQINAQQTDLSRNAGIYQQGVQNSLNAAQQNAGNILNASQGITGANALQSQFLGQYANLAGLGQQYNQGVLDQNANNWYNQNYGYDQQRLANMGNALGTVQGAYQGSSTTGLNPAYQQRSAGGALASAGGGALAGASIGGPWGAAIGGGIGLLGYYI